MASNTFLKLILLSASLRPGCHCARETCLLSLVQICCWAVDLKVHKGRWEIAMATIPATLAFVLFFLLVAPPLFWGWDMGEGREIQEKRRILTTYSSALAAIMTLPYLLIFQTACLQIRKLPREVFFFYNINSWVSSSAIIYFRKSGAGVLRICVFLEFRCFFDAQWDLKT